MLSQLRSELCRNARVARQIKFDILCESVAHCQRRFSGSCSAVRAFWVFSHNPKVEASKNNGDEIHHTARYKNGTSSQAFCAFPSLPYRALQCDRCLVITMFSSLFTPFHGGNTGSNPVGDANSFQSLTQVSSETRGTTTVQVGFGLIMPTTLLWAARLSGLSACV